MSYTPPADLRALEGTTLEWTASHLEDARALLLSTFRGKPRIEALLGALLGGVQDLTDATWQVLVGRGLDWATGAQLDNLGGLVDLPRRGWSDETYRQLLRVQILVLRSSGSWPEFLRIVEALGMTRALASVYDPGFATAILRLGEPIEGDITADEIFAMLVRAKTGGVRFDLEVPVELAEDSLTWADGAADQADTRRGWADDASTSGGYWVDVRSTEDA